MKLDNECSGNDTLGTVGRLQGNECGLLNNVRGRRWERRNVPADGGGAEEVLSQFTARLILLLFSQKPDHVLFSAVACSGIWNLYEWNKVKGRYKKVLPPNRTPQISSQCCLVM